MIRDEHRVVIDTVVAGCIAHEVESKGKLMGANAEDQAAREYLQNMARSSCAKVGKSCNKERTAADARDMHGCTNRRIEGIMCRS